MFIYLIFLQVKENDDFTSSLTDEKRCHTGEDETLLTLYISEFFSDISPKQRIIAIVRLANFMGLNQVII